MFWHKSCGLSFPNMSRTYDSTRHAVRFWGHDSSVEISFFVTDDALFRLDRGVRSHETNFLRVFDANVARIHAAARKAYTRGRKGSYELSTRDF